MNMKITKENKRLVKAVKDLKVGDTFIYDDIPYIVVDTTEVMGEPKNTYVLDFENNEVIDIDYIGHTGFVDIIEAELIYK